MPNQHVLKASIILVSIALSGCVSTTQPATTPSVGAHKALNQPKIDSLVTLDESAPNLTPANNDIASPESLEKLGKVELTVNNASSQHLDVNEQLFTSNWDSLGKPTIVKSFEMKAGQKYGETIANWLDVMGYEVDDTLLSSNDEEALAQKATESFTFFETLPIALKRLVEHLDNSSKVGIGSGFHISFSGSKAIIHGMSTQMKVHVAGGMTIEPDIKTLQVYRGETYEAVLMRWLSDAGYETFGKLLSNDMQTVMLQVTPSSETIQEPLEKATTLLLAKAREQAIQDKRTDIESFISNDSKSEIQHHLYLDGAQKEAILTSSNQPVEMFHVKPGSLKDNFLALSDEWGWKANETHFMAEEYRVTFGFPIVTEKGNMKDALNALLVDYPKLRGAIVPSTRQAYVLMEQ